MTAALIAATGRPAGLGPGLGAVVGIAAVGTALSSALAVGGMVVSPLVVALLLGLVAAQVAPLPTRLLPGVTFAAKPLLRLAIVLLGLRIGLPQVAAIGITGGVAIVAIVIATMAFGWFVARALGLSRDLAWLLAAGHAICGAAAIAAADSVLRAKEREVAAAITLVTLFGTVAMVAVPGGGELLGLEPTAYGFWAGGSVHEVAQAIAAGFARGEQAGEMASLVKMVRVACLLPLGLMLALVAVRRGGRAASRLLVPWFVVAFAVVAVVDAAGAIPAAVAAPLCSVGTVAMTMAMAALGLKSSLREVAAAGWRPIAAASATTLFVSGAAFAFATLR